MDRRTGNFRCLLCLLTISKEEQDTLDLKNKRGKNVLKLIQSSRNYTNSNHQNIIPNEDICGINFCPECILIIDTASEIHDQIVRLEGKLRTQIVLIENKILFSDNGDGFDDEKLDKLRRSLLSLSG
jgi:hypothetical protein